jgi:hypothetical protein
MNNTKFPIPTHDPQTGELNPKYEELTGMKNPLDQPHNISELDLMTTKKWRTYGEIQYIRGRLDELFKVTNLVDLDMHGIRFIDARITKYLTKLRRVDPIAYELYRIEKDNIERSLMRAKKK